MANESGNVEQLLGTSLANGETRKIKTDDNGILQTAQINQTLVEQKTQANAVAGVLIFSENINCVEIYNTDTINDGIFTVNGIGITVPKDKSFTAIVGGVPSTQITVTGSTSYIISRYV